MISVVCSIISWYNLVGTSNYTYTYSNIIVAGNVVYKTKKNVHKNVQKIRILLYVIVHGICSYKINHHSFFFKISLNKNIDTHLF